MADQWVVMHEGRELYLPPNDLLKGPRVILDIGSCTGITASGYRALYPDASVICVEPDHANAQECRAKGFPTNELAVWTHTGLTKFRLWGQETGHIDDSRPAKLHDQPLIEQLCITMDDLIIPITMIGDTWRFIDFVKMDIEGAEHAVLAMGGDWVDRVTALFVEVHDDTNDHVRALMENLDYEIVHEEHERIWGMHV